MTETEEAEDCLARQDLWRKRLAEAEIRYHESVIRLQSLADAGAGLDAARAEKAAARANYLRILRIFTDLVLRGKEPEEPA